MGRLLRLIIGLPLLLIVAPVAGLIFGCGLWWGALRKRDDELPESEDNAVTEVAPEEEDEAKRRRWLADMRPSERIEACVNWWQRQMVDAGAPVEPLEVWAARRGHGNAQAG